MAVTYDQPRATTLADVLEDDPDVATPAYVQRRLDGDYRDKPIITGRDGKAPTCVAHYAKDHSTRMVDDGKRVRPYSVREFARLQGFPDWFDFAGSDNDAYRQIGNAVAVPMARWVGTQIRGYFRERGAA